MRGRTGRWAVAIGALVLASSAVAPATKAAVADPGFGKAQAQLLMLDPRSAQLSFGVRFGPTVADHRNLVARAQAQSTDYGIIGSALSAEGCSGEPVLRAEDLPQRMQADSRDPAGQEVREVSEGPITQSEQALPRPFSRATSRLAEVNLPGILTIRGATSATTSGVLPDGTASVEATVDVGDLSILGLVELRGLHWRALHQRGKEPQGTFTIGDATIAGVPVPTQDASALVQLVNDVLSTLGIVVVPPVSHIEGDTIFVDPIKVGVAPNPTRDLIAGSVLELLQPAREALFQAILDASCDSGALITVIDILLGSVTGGGSFTAVVGGAQAQRTEAGEGVVLGERGAASGSGGLGGPGADLGGGLGAVPAGGTGSALGSGPDLGPAAETSGDAAGAGAGAGSTGQRAAATTTDDDRGPAIAVGLGALLLGGLLLEADRRKMRQAGVLATTTVPTEAPSG